MANFIKSYINFFGQPTIVTRGKAIFKNKDTKIFKQEISQDLLYAKYNVVGTSLYTVVVKNFLAANIESSCTCPYDFSSMCKHQVAVLLDLEERLKDKKTLVADPVKVSPKSRAIGESFLIPNIASLGFDDIFKWANMYYLEEFTITGFDLNDTELTFELSKISEFGIRVQNAANITVYRKGKLFYIRTDFSKDPVKPYNAKRKINEYEAYVLHYLLSCGLDLSNILVKENQDLLKKQTTKAYGLPASKFDDYFLFQIGKNGFTRVLQPEHSGLMNLTENLKGSYQEYIDTIKTYKHEQKKNRLQQSVFKLGFVLEPMAEGYGNEFEALYFIKMFKGERTKRGKGLKGLDWLDEDAPVPEYASANQLEIFNLKKQIETAGLRYYYRSVKDFDTNKHFLVLGKILELLRHEEFVYIVPLNGEPKYGSTKKSDLKTIVIPEKFQAKLQVRVEEKNGFITLIPKVLVEGKKIVLNGLSSMKVSNTGFAIGGKKQSDGYVFYTMNPNDAHILADILDSAPKVVKSQTKDFIKHVALPISKMVNVEIDSEIPIQIEKVNLYPEQKQVFLTEEDDFLVITPQVKYDNEIEVKLDYTGDEVVEKEGLLVHYCRDSEYENAFLETLSGMHPFFDSQQLDGEFYLPLEFLLEEMWFYKFFEELKKHHVEVYGLKNLKNFKYSPHKPTINTSVTSGQDWFDINIDVKFGSQNVSLKEIRKAIVNKEQFVKLKDGSVGILPEDWLKKMERHFKLGEVKGEELKISKLKFSVVHELFEELDEAEILEEIAEKKLRLENFTNIKDTKIPKQITATLRDYQKEGFNWLHFLHEMKWGGILADDMGLGKTLQIITFIQSIISENKLPNLVVVPTSLLFNWKNELEKFGPKLKAYFYHGLNRENDIKKLSKNNLLITTYGLIGRNADFFSQMEFNYVILDESQAIKNPNSMRYKAVRLLKGNNKLALTGTPIENNTFDLYAQMNFVNPGFFGSMEAFRKNFAMPIDKDNNQEAAADLQKMINPFVLRHTKEQVATELPPKTENVIYCEMQPAQRKVYEAYKNEYRNKILKKIEEEGIGKSKFFVLEALTRLRQICNSPLLLKDKHINTDESIKIKELMSHILEKTSNHKVLLFSQFTSMLALVKEKLESNNVTYEYLDGKCTTKQRQQSVNNFQENDDIRVFLISLKAGGTGLNLTAADYVYIIDPWWNPAVENQAIDRCYRIGQDKSVMAYRMICKDTIEEKIVQLQDKKRKMASDIIQTDESIMKSLDKDSLQNLFA